MRLVPRFLLVLGAYIYKVAADKGACIGNATADQVAAGLHLHGKVAIVTGGDSGLGYSVAGTLAKLGATVVIANRDQAKGEQAAKELAAASGSVVRSFPLDLSSLESVRTFAQRFFSDMGPNLHFLINNAGIGGNPGRRSVDGFELLFQVDYLGHFLLTELLLPALRKSPGAAVVNVASGAHENACEAAGWQEGCFGNLSNLPPPVLPKINVTIHYKTGPVQESASTYGVAKFLQIQHAAELAEREATNGVSAYSLTPGFVNTSMTEGTDPDSPEVRRICSQQAPPDPCPFSPEQGSAVVAFCALRQPPSGRYYSRVLGCLEKPVVQHGLTPELRHELYELSARWAGLSPSSVPGHAEYV